MTSARRRSFSSCSSLPVAAASPAILAALLLARKRIGRIEGAGLIALYGAYVAAAIAISA